MNKGLFGGLQVEDFSYDKISSIQYNVGLLMGDITIFASGNKATIKHIEKAQTRDFADFLRSNLDKKDGDSAVNKSSSTEDTVSKLERLAVLKEKGIIDEEEFMSEKKKILSEA